jgi:nucleotide-binding universal stress UspA family protein
MNLQRILVPTDLSDFGRSALRWAAAFHDRVGSRITLIYANEPYFPIDVVEAASASYALLNGPEIRERFAEELRKYARENFADPSAVDTLVVDQAPGPAILDTAKDTGADLILMGTHGRRGWQRLLLGSVTEGVLHGTETPLMTVPRAAADRMPALGKILVPVNFTPVARQSLEAAVSLGEAFGSELLVVRAAENVDARENLEQWVEPIVGQRLRTTYVPAKGEAAEETLRIADAQDVDLIVIGAQHKRFRDATVIGTTTERVVRFATRPVLTVIARAE